jgi:hypothetical protein
VSTFWADVQERAAKSFAGGAVAYLFEMEVGITHYSLPVRVAVFGLGMGAASVVTSLVSRFRKSASGAITASLVRRVDYDER